MSRTKTASALSLLRCVAGWEQLREEDFSMEPMAASMTNHVFKCTTAAPMEPGVVLLRLYGSPEGLFERTDDLRSYRLMEAVGMAPKLIVAEEEGRIEEFLVNFKAASFQELRQPQIMQCIAQTLARFHLETTCRASTCESESDWICVWDRLRAWHERAKLLRPDFVAELERQSKRILDGEIDALEGRLRNDAESLSFCHCDLQQGNIMVHESANEVRLIDYEYACLAAVEFDIANHWGEWCADYETATPHCLHACQFPSPQQQTTFIRHYLTAARAHNHSHQFSDAQCSGATQQWKKMSSREATDATVEECRQRVLEYVPMCHLLWALWSIIQCSVSTVDFDFESYARQRFALFCSSSSTSSMT